MLSSHRIVSYLLVKRPFRILSLAASRQNMTDDKRWVSHYSGPETPIKNICEQFSKYEGGKVELVKDEEIGIATITINHPERRNALSGMRQSTSNICLIF